MEGTLPLLCEIMLSSVIDEEGRTTKLGEMSSEEIVKLCY